MDVSSSNIPLPPPSPPPLNVNAESDKFLLESSMYNKFQKSRDEYGEGSSSGIGYVGLVNQAMTCYLNSLLQALYMTPEFRQALYNWEYDQIDGSKSIPYQLQKLFLKLQVNIFITIIRMNY